MTRTIQAEEAHPITSSKQDRGTGYVHFAPQDEIISPIIDADECQARHAAQIVRSLKHQSRIIEVA